MEIDDNVDGERGVGPRPAHGQTGLGSGVGVGVIAAAADTGCVVVVRWFGGVRSGRRKEGTKCVEKIIELKICVFLPSLPNGIEGGQWIQGLLQELEDGRSDDRFLRDALKRHPSRQRRLLVKLPRSDHGRRISRRLHLVHQEKLILCLGDVVDPNV